MLFICLFNLREKASTMEERLAMRANWTYPEGMNVLAEYWLHTSRPYSITIFEADDIAPIVLSYAAWEDMFDITIVPAISAEDGLKMAQQLMAK